MFTFQFLSIIQHNSYIYIDTFIQVSFEVCFVLTVPIRTKVRSPFFFFNCFEISNGELLLFLSVYSFGQRIMTFRCSNFRATRWKKKHCCHQVYFHKRNKMSWQLKIKLKRALKSCSQCFFEATCTR